jgi:hypothetical protein
MIIAVWDSDFDAAARAAADLGTIAHDTVAATGTTATVEIGWTFPVAPVKRYVNYTAVGVDRRRQAVSEGIKHAILAGFLTTQREYQDTGRERPARGVRWPSACTAECSSRFRRSTFSGSPRRCARS